MRLLSLLVILLFALAACSPLTTPAVPPSPASAIGLMPGSGADAPAQSTPLSPTFTPWTPNPTFTPQPRGQAITPTPEVYQVVAVSVRVRGSTQAVPDVDAGITTAIDLVFTPVNLAIMRRPDGSASGYSTTPWEGAPLAQFRYCLAAGTGCAPPQNWQPYQGQVSAEVKVDWLGPRPFFLWAEFRDTQAKIILSTGPTNPALPKAQTSASLTLNARVNPATPLAKLPPPIQTAVVLTRQAFPVTGSVQINNGACCAGGAAGAHITLKVAFQASSPAGRVTDMKVQTGSGCVKDPTQLLGSWETFQPARSYDTTLAINWVGWWVSVQYRDAAGNLSPVYCDDISLEGSPPIPTP